MRGALDHAERPGDRARRVGDGHAGARRAVVECDHLHASARRSASSAFASASPSFSGFLPPARAIVAPPAAAAADLGRGLLDHGDRVEPALERPVEVRDEVHAPVLGASRARPRPAPAPA